MTGCLLAVIPGNTGSQRYRDQVAHLALVLELPDTVSSYALFACPGGYEEGHNKPGLWSQYDKKFITS